MAKSYAYTGVTNVGEGAFMEGLAGVLNEGEPLIERAMQAVRRFHEARDSSTPREEVERLRDEAEALMKELSAFQMDALQRITPKA